MEPEDWYPGERSLDNGYHDNQQVYQPKNEVADEEEEEEEDGWSGGEMGGGEKRNGEGNE